MDMLRIVIPEASSSMTSSPRFQVCISYKHIFIWIFSYKAQFVKCQFLFSATFKKLLLFLDGLVFLLQTAVVFPEVARIPNKCHFWDT